MPFNGSGTFQSLPPPQFPAIPGTTIRSHYFNAVVNDLIAGLSTTITKDGQTTPLANLPMGGKKHTGAAPAAAGGEYVTLDQLQQQTPVPGLSLLGYTHSATGGVGQMAHQRLERIADVLDFGAAADNATDAYTPTLRLRNYLNGSGVLKFPYVPGTANTYKFVTVGTYAVFDGHTLDVDEGVTLSFPDASFLYAAVTYKVVRPFKVFNVAKNYTTWVTPHRNQPLVEKKIFLMAGDVDLSKLQPIICSDGTTLRHQQVSWPGGDTFSSASPTAVSVSGVNWTNPTTGVFSVSFARVQPGDELSAYFAGATGGPALTAMVRGHSGYAGLYSSTADDGTGTQTFRKYSGSSAVSADVGYYGKGTHASYAGVRSLWTIRIVDWFNYQVLFNGGVVSQGKLNSPIEEAGFGMYCNAAAGVTAQDWVLRRNGVQWGNGTPLSIATFGDSGTANRYECWPNYMRETLEGTLGLRVVQLTNRAVSGDGAAEQWNQMNTLGIAGANIVVIQIGTNDIQNQTSKTTFVATLLNMLNYCTAAGATVIFGLPPQFYTQGQAGARGEASTNYEKGAYIRSAVQRFCADNGLKCVDTGQALGAMLANYVNPALSPYWGADPMNDPMVMDNIHPGAVMERLLGLVYAQAVAGVVAQLAQQIVPGSLYLEPNVLPAGVMQNGWAMTTDPVRWSSDSSGNVNFSGVLDKGTGALADGTVIAILPRNLWPKRSKRMVCATNLFTNPCMLQVDSANGQVRIYGAQAGTTYVYADGMIYNIQQG